MKRQRLTEYKNYRPNSEYHEGKGVWSIKCDIALPCATQNELGLEDAKTLVANGVTIEGKTVTVSGAGNVAIYAIEKAKQLGAKVVTCSDSTGWIYDPDGIDVAALKEIKEVKRQRLTEYKTYRPNAE